MTTIQDLPQEILSVIFQSFTYRNIHLQQCQKVCRAWYFTAHTLLLKRVNLYTNVEIDKFVSSIDANPHESYLSAVRSVNIHDFRGSEEPPIFLDGRRMDRLFFRFPNLEKITIDGEPAILDFFDDEMCDILLQCCPYLDTFEASINADYPTDYYACMFKVRLLVTSINVKQLVALVPQFDIIVQFLSCFPQLKRMYGSSRHFDSFRAWMPLLERLPNYPSVAISVDDLGAEDLGLQYLASKTQREQDQLVERLSRVSHVSYKPNEGFCASSMEFMTRYLTGLQSFRMTNSYNQEWTNLQQRVFCNNILDSVCSAKNHSHLHLPKMNFDMLSSHFPTVIRKVFEKLSPNNHLQLYIKDKTNLVGLADLSVKISKKRHTRDVNIVSRNQLDLDTIATSLFNTQLNNISEFELTIKTRREKNSATATVDAYEKIIRGMPSLKSVILDIPASFQDNAPKQFSGVTHGQVENVTLRANKDAKFQTLLDRFSCLFPNIQRLILCYSSGVWNDEDNEFQVVLPSYNLETLAIDVTPVKNKIIENIANVECFFVVDVELKNSDERQTYKVELGPFSVTEVNANDLEGKYYRLRITINSLERLKLVLDDEDYQDEDYWYEDCESRVILFE